MGAPDGDKKHWSEQKEKGGGYWQMRLMLGLYRRIGPRALRVLIHPVVAVFFLVSPGARRVSRLFLDRVAALTGRPRRRGEVYYHLYSFACSLVDKMAAWSNDLRLGDLDICTEGVDHLVDSINRGRGACILCSHLGNMEMLRALASLEVGKVIRNFGITSIVDFSGSANFNRMLEELNPGSMVRLVSASDMGPDTIILLQDRIAAGELVIIAGDRTAKGNRGRTNQVSFLGEPAWFPQGSFVLASLLEAPIYFMFGVRADDRDPDSRYGFHVFPAATDLTGSRRERQRKIQALVEEYVGRLEDLCLKHPFQWYNFFDFWTNPAEAASPEGDA
jgi:predicted LPLAT superfamily acyltransferase